MTRVAADETDLISASSDLIHWLNMCTGSHCIFTLSDKTKTPDLQRWCPGVNWLPFPFYSDFKGVEDCFLRGILQIFLRNTSLSVPNIQCFLYFEAPATSRTLWRHFLPINTHTHLWTPTHILYTIFGSSWTFWKPNWRPQTLRLVNTAFVGKQVWVTPVISRTSPLWSDKESNSAIKVLTTHSAFVRDNYHGILFAVW